MVTKQIFDELTNEIIDKSLRVIKASDKATPYRAPKYEFFRTLVSSNSYFDALSRENYEK